MSDRLKEIFVEPQTCYKFTEKEVANDTLNELYNLVKWGPTSFNSSPMRLKFLKSSTSKEKLSKLVSDDNDLVDKEFFNGTTIKSNFLCNLGYAAEGGFYERAPRYDFSDIAEII